MTEEKIKILNALESQLFGNTCCCLELNNTDDLSAVLSDRLRIITERIDSLSIERDTINKLLTYFKENYYETD